MKQTRTLVELRAKMTPGPWQSAVGSKGGLGLWGNGSVPFAWMPAEYDEINFVEGQQIHNATAIKAVPELLALLAAEVEYATAVDYCPQFGDGPIATEAKLRIGEAVVVALNKLGVTP